MEVGEEGDYIPIVTLSHQNDSCIKMGSGENHFNVSLIVTDRVTRQFPQTTIFEEKGEPKRIRTEVPLLQYQPNALPLGQTGSLSSLHAVARFFKYSAVLCSPTDSLRSCRM